MSYLTVIGPNRSGGNGSSYSIVEFGIDMTVTNGTWEGDASYTSGTARLEFQQANGTWVLVDSWTFRSTYSGGTQRIYTKAGVQINHRTDGVLTLRVIATFTDSSTSLGTLSVTGAAKTYTYATNAKLSSVTHANDESDPAFKISSPSGTKTIRMLVKFPPASDTSTTIRFFEPNISAADGSTKPFDLDKAVTSNDRIGTMTGGTPLNQHAVFGSMTRRQVIQYYAKSANNIALRYGIYTGSGATTTGLNYVDKTIPIVPAAPTFTASQVTLADVNETSSELTGGGDTIISGLSDLKATCTAATGQKYATIDHYTFKLTGEDNGHDVSSGSTGYTWAGATSGTVTVSAVDSRGNATAVTKTATVISYSPPSVSLCAFNRSNGGMGASVTVSAEGTWQNGSFGAESNTLAASYKYRLHNASAWTTGSGTLTLTKSGNSFECSGTLAETFITGNAYDIQLILTDAIASTSYTSMIPVAHPAFKVTGSSLIIPEDSTMVEDATGTRKQLMAHFLDIFYPVGKVYESTDSTSPALLFGGTWSRFGNGKVLVGVNEGDTDFNTVEKTGGAKTHTHGLETNGYAKIALSQSIMRTLGKNKSGVPTYTANAGSFSNYYSGNTTSNATELGGTTDADGALPPYITVYRWVRVA